jgi:hypothetical protein
MLRKLSDTDTPSGALRIGDLGCIKNEGTGSMRSAYSHFGFGWFRIEYEYDHQLPGATNFNSKTVSLPAEYNIRPEVAAGWNPEDGPPPLSP